MAMIKISRRRSKIMFNNYKKLMEIILYNQSRNIRRLDSLQCDYFRILFYIRIFCCNNFRIALFREAKTAGFFVF